jgi:hypothetical protein
VNLDGYVHPFTKLGLFTGKGGAGFSQQFIDEFFNHFLFCGTVVCAEAESPDPN